MIRLLADENFDGRIIAALRKEWSDLDVVRVQDEGLGNTPDPDILAWAAREGRILLTHDKKTMGPLAHARVRAGQPMPGVCLVKRNAPLGLIISDLLILLANTSVEEWDNQVKHVPL
jgi:predicted nuclease of predicted toxin-antitoxin system